MAKKIRRRWSPEEKAEILGRFHASGLSREAFGREEGISSTVLGNWLQKKSKREIAAPNPGLVPVRVKCKDLASTIDILLRGGRRVRVVEGFDEKLLEQVISTLERC